MQYKLKTITAARFIIAVGGRPTPLQCPGAEYAITSDDLFMKETPPGKTCVVGAGYVALECAGFLTGLHQGEVTVLVRSMLLRGFDRDLVKVIQSYMVASGTRIIEGVLPKSIVKLPSGKLAVTYGPDDIVEEFDTVLAGINFLLSETIIFASFKKLFLSYWESA
jgi:thioredoxin reductase (NADPH)